MAETAASYRVFFHTLIGQLIEFLGSIFSARTNHPVDKQNASNPAGRWKINHKIDRSMTGKGARKALITKKTKSKLNDSEQLSDIIQLFLNYQMVFFLFLQSWSPFVIESLR